MTDRREFLLGGSALAIAAASGSFGLTAAQAAEGGTLTAVVTTEVASLDPIFGTVPGPDRNVYNLFAENLLYADAKGDFQPALAESWEIAPDGLSITFKLRPDVKFQDGTPFDAEAVKFNLERVASPDIASQSRQYMTDFDGVEVVDPLTAKVKLKRPSGPFLSVLSNEAGYIVSPEAVESRGADFARNPVGTGPFAITSWTSGKVDAARFDGYWGTPAPLDTVTVRTISNSAVKLVELQAGTTQLGDLIQVKDMEQVQADPNLQLLDIVQQVTSYIAFNNQKGVFKDNLHLRKAISHALNREALERAVAKGLGGVLTAFDPPASPVFADAAGHAYDVDLAREEYKLSGHSGPLTMIVIQRDPDTQVAQFVQAMCAEAGIDLKISILERAAWVEKVLAYDYEIGLLRNGSPRPDPDLPFSQFFGRTASQDFAGIKNPEIWDLVDQARALTDMAERKKIYVEIQQKILDNYWQTYLFWAPQKEVARTSLQGFEREFSSAWRYNTISLDT